MGDGGPQPDSLNVRPRRSSVTLDTRGMQMAVCRIIETDRTPEEYDLVRAKVGVGDSPPPGAKLHIAARGDDGKIRIIEVWDSREQAEEFGERVRAARNELGFGGGMPPITYFEVHRHITA